MLLISWVEMLQGCLVVSAKSGAKVPEFDRSSYIGGFYADPSAQREL